MSGRKAGPTATEFDQFAAEYEHVHSRNIRITGENSDYFASYKASYITREVGADASRVLDYGCGIGLLSRHLKRCLPSAQIDGYDVSALSLERVDELLRAQGVFTAEPARLGCGYDVVILANVLHHVPPAGRQRLVCEVGALLADGGKLVIFEHNPKNPLTRWAVEHCPFDEGAVLLTVAESRRYVEQGALSLARQDYIVFFPHWLRILRPLEPWLRWCDLGAQYVVVGVRAET